MTFSDNRYGDEFADVYDEWYADLDDVEAVAAVVESLAAGGRVLELGVGTGRLAIPIARRLAPHGGRVVGIDNSAAMLARLVAGAAGSVEPVLGHMVRDMPDGPFAVVLVGHNTLFNLTADGEQRACIAAAALRLTPGGHLLVDCAIPEGDGEARDVVSRGGRRYESTGESADGMARGRFVPLGDGRPRNWEARLTPPERLDAWAHEAGLDLAERWSSWAGDTFDRDSARHVSRYVRRERH